MSEYYEEEETPKPTPKKKVKRKHRHVGPNVRAFKVGRAFCPVCSAESTERSDRQFMRRRGDVQER